MQAPPGLGERIDLAAVYTPAAERDCWASQKRIGIRRLDRLFEWVAVLVFCVGFTAGGATAGSITSDDSRIEALHQCGIHDSAEQTYRNINDAYRLAKRTFSDNIPDVQDAYFTIEACYQHLMQLTLDALPTPCDLSAQQSSSAIQACYDRIGEVTSSRSYRCAHRKAFLEASAFAEQAAALARTNNSLGSEEVTRDDLQHYQGLVKSLNVPSCSK